MVNAALGTIHPEAALAIAYAPRDRRRAFAALLDLDARLGAIVAAAREPMIGQMRLTWWHDALAALDTAPPPPEPLLRDLAASVLPLGVSGRDLSTLIDGWERLIDVETLDLPVYARERGGALFTLGAALVGMPADPVVIAAGERWALTGLAVNADPPLAAQARALVMPVTHHRWPRALRPLGALALSAEMDLAGRPPGSPARVARLLRLRLTGR